MALGVLFLPWLCTFIATRLILRLALAVGSVARLHGSVPSRGTLGMATQLTVWLLCWRGVSAGFGSSAGSGRMGWGRSHIALAASRRLW